MQLLENLDYLISFIDQSNSDCEIMIASKIVEG